MLAEGIERLATIISRMLKEEAASGGKAKQGAATQADDAKDLW